MAKDPAPVDPAADPSVAVDSTVAPPAPEAEKDADGDLATDEKSEAKEAAKKASLKANSDGVDLTASTVPSVPSVNTPPAVDANAKPLSQPEVAQHINDVTPEAEAALQVADPNASVDGSGILQQTNQEVLDQLPKNENGQVVLDENGQVVGLAPANQPSPQPGSQA